MDQTAYFEALTREMGSLRDRIRHFIGDAHWQTDGEWKESVLRSILRRHLPTTIGVGSGFIVTRDGPSTQIDILLYDRTRPVLFRDGDFVIVTPDATVGVIEVKTKVRGGEYRSALTKINEIAKLHRKQPTVSQPVFGLFSFEGDDFDSGLLLEPLKNEFKGLGTIPIHLISIGQSYFVRYWDLEPTNPKRPAHKWEAYKLKNKAPAYFIHNIIVYWCSPSTDQSSELWFPPHSKENHKIGEIEMNQEPLNRST